MTKQSRFTTDRDGRQLYVEATLHSSPGEPESTWHPGANSSAEMEEWKRRAA